MGFVDRTGIANEIANDVEEDLKDYVFDTTPPAYSVTSKERKKALEDHEEEQYIRLKNKLTYSILFAAGFLIHGVLCL